MVADFGTAGMGNDLSSSVPKPSVPRTLPALLALAAKGKRGPCSSLEVACTQNLAFTVKYLSSLISFRPQCFPVFAVSGRQAGENLGQYPMMPHNLGEIAQPFFDVRAGRSFGLTPWLHLRTSSSPKALPGSRAGDLRLCGAPSSPRPLTPGASVGAKGWKKHSDAKHAKNYFTDKQQRTGFVSGAELVIYYTNILLKGKEWLKYTHSLTQIKSQCAFSIASPTPQLSAAFGCSPWLQHRHRSQRGRRRAQTVGDICLRKCI